MARLSFYLFLAAAGSCAVLGSGEVTPPPAIELVSVDPLPPVTVEELGKKTTTSSTTSTTSTTTSTSSTTTSTTPPTTTSTTTSTTSTTPPTTTSTTTSTTSTTPPTTTSTTTTTTTPPPPTPPPSPTPPPPQPKPVPAPEQGSWMYTDEHNVTCILAQFAAQITLTYSKSVMNKTTIANVTMNVPANATLLGGSCNASSDQWLRLGWTEQDVANSILMLFRRNHTTNKYAMHQFNLTVDARQLVNLSVPAEVIVLSHGEEWETPLATSYQCTPVTRLSMSNETYNVSASVAVSRLQEEAFRTVSGKGFSVARECGGGDVPDTVPIVVGCTLGALVLVVLAAYLIARRRSAARGYLSM